MAWKVSQSCQVASGSSATRRAVPTIACGCHTISIGVLRKPGGLEERVPVQPGARLANSTRGQGLLALHVGGVLAETCARASLVSSATMRAARASPIRQTSEPHHRGDRSDTRRVARGAWPRPDVVLAIGRPSPPCSRYGAFCLGWLRLGPTHSPKRRVVEVGAVQRIDVGAKILTKQAAGAPRSLMAAMRAKHRL